MNEHILSHKNDVFVIDIPNDEAPPVVQASQQHGFISDMNMDQSTNSSNLEAQMMLAAQLSSNQS